MGDTTVTAAALMSLLDVPLTVLLLAGLAVFKRLPSAADLLAWCGEHSWGIYLGQMVVHTSLLAVGWWGPLEEVVLRRWAYAAALTVGAVGLVVMGNALRQLPTVRD
jgi:peptidoglycan/LPS O-acetylase OafA/YrhL